MATQAKQQFSTGYIQRKERQKRLFQQPSFPSFQLQTKPPATTDSAEYRQPQPGEMMANVMRSMDSSQINATPRQILEVNGSTQEPVQLMSESPTETTAAPVSESKNQTGLPDRLKAGMENLSGFCLDDVKVHYNSSKPAQLQALAYAQGTDIHVGPGQERHLPHEAWHVVQQKQGRVKPTILAKGVAINEDSALEREADVMGREATGYGTKEEMRVNRRHIEGEKHNVTKAANTKIVQGRLETCHELQLRTEKSKLAGFTSGVIQRLPTNKLTKKSNDSGTYWNRKETQTIGQDKVPSRTTAIMRDAKNGGVPTVSPPGWSWLISKNVKLKGQWVRFHIINEHLGGPGNDPMNLVPTIVSVNNEFSREIEQPAKKSALKEKQWTYVDVITHYKDTWPAAIPDKIDTEWGKWNKNKQQWEKIKSHQLQNKDITTMDIGNYLAGTGITIAAIINLGKKTKAINKAINPDQANVLQKWLKTYTQANDNDDDMWDEMSKVQTKNGTLLEDVPGLLDAKIWLEDDGQGKYRPVINLG